MRTLWTVDLNAESPTLWINPGLHNLNLYEITCVTLDCGFKCRRESAFGAVNLEYTYPVSQPTTHPHSPSPSGKIAARRPEAEVPDPHGARAWYMYTSEITLATAGGHPT